VDHGPNGEYEARQSVRDAEYRESYKAWIKSLDADTLRHIAEMDLDEPEYGYNNHQPDWSDLIERTAAPQPESALRTDATAATEAVARLLLHLMTAADIRWEVYCLAYLFGITDQAGLSCNDIAAKFGKVRASLSKHVLELQKQLGVRPCRAMKSKKACETYRLTNGRSRSASKA
jgi:hypothetical protein